MVSSNYLLCRKCFFFLLCLRVCVCVRTHARLCVCVCVCGSGRARECGCTCFTVVQGSAPWLQRPQCSLTVVSPPPHPPPSSSDWTLQTEVTPRGFSGPFPPTPPTSTHSPFPQACPRLSSASVERPPGGLCPPRPEVSVTNSVACMPCHSHAMLWTYTHANRRKTSDASAFCVCRRRGGFVLLVFITN